jgi:hypothetical protein
MKKLFLLAALSFSLLASCTKEKDDSLVKNSNLLLSKTEMLTQQTWWVDELYHRLNVGTSHYKRNGENTTGITYDNMRFTFNADGSGTHVDQNGNILSLFWEFTGGGERNILLNVGGLSYQWSLVEITEEAVHATVAVTVNSEDILESFRLQPANDGND